MQASLKAERPMSIEAKLSIMTLRKATAYLPTACVPADGRRITRHRSGAFLFFVRHDMASTVGVTWNRPMPTCDELRTRPARLLL